MTISFVDILGSNGDEWMSHPDRPCAYRDVPDAWFPTEAHQARAARELCAGCPVQTACLTYALDERIEWGIWGATAEEERRLILKQAAA